jgi:hypothetical protein
MALPFKEWLLAISLSIVTAQQPKGSEVTTHLVSLTFTYPEF